MKKLFVIGIVAMMVMGLGVAASAASWMTFIWAGSGTGFASLEAQIGEFTSVISGYTSPGTPAVANAMVALESTPTGAGGTYRLKDVRKAVDMPNPLQYNLFVTSGADYAAPKIDVKFRASSAALASPLTWYVYNQDKSVKYWEGKFTSFASAAAAPIAFQIDKVAGGTNLLLTTVAAQPPITTPEPGSILAMLSGMVGLVGYGIRRRK